MKSNSLSKSIDVFWDAALKDNVQDIRRYVAGNINVNAVDEFGNTALHMAALASSFQAVKALLRLPAVDVMKVDNVGDTPLDLARAYGNEKIAKAIEAEVKRRNKQLLTTGAKRVPEHTM